MSTPDLNLLVALDVLLEEVSVVRAAKRLRLSASAMSRTLSRLREATGDPLLVRAGRGLVPTPRALELQARVGPLVREAEAALRPVADIDPRLLDRTFVMRTSEGFVETFGPSLIARLEREAPHTRLHFVPKPERDSGPLRTGSVDLETGVIDALTGPELKSQALFLDRLVGVVRAGHPLGTGKLTRRRYLAARHVEVRRASGPGPMDALLVELGAERDIATTVVGFATAIALARASDLVATVPERHTEALRVGVHSFTLPFPSPTFTVSLLWHPRLDADPANRWLRGIVREVCQPRSEPVTRAPRVEVARAIVGASAGRSRR